MLKQWSLLLLCSFLLSACNNDNDETLTKSQQEELKQQATGYYTVKQGDTLSAIGMAYGLDYLELARWNHLAPPYPLNIGQKIQLFNGIATEKKSLPAAQTPTTIQKTYIVKKGDTLYSIGRRFKVDHDLLAGLNNLPSAEHLYVGQVLKISKSKQKHITLKSAQNQTSNIKKTRFLSKKTSIISINNKNMLKFYCQLPVTGRILKNFVQTRYRGIEISANLGDPVRAAASGKVVAVASVIYGYGVNIIIQHNDIYLTTYSNNRRALVTKGQNIKQGQVIGEVGRIGRNPPSVQFEVREHGKLVNPIHFLATQ